MVSTPFLFYVHSFAVLLFIPGYFHPFHVLSLFHTGQNIRNHPKLSSPSPEFQALPGPVIDVAMAWGNFGSFSFWLFVVAADIGT
jgi:hypothetical protein